MSSKFLLANMLSSLNNKRPLDRSPIRLEYSNLCMNVLNILSNDGYVEVFEKKEVEKIPYINVHMTIKKNQKLMKSFKIFSTPGCRCYKTIDEIKHLISRNKYKTYVISTSKGVMNAFDAMKIGIGGELLCEVF